MSDSFTNRIEELLKSRSKNIIADWDLKPSSVLVPIFTKGGERHLLFTKRTENLRNHPGQISFPGGRHDKSDESLWETALRETEEEIGVKREHVKFLGELDDMLTSTQYRITPFVASIPYPYEFVVNCAEIDAIIEVPIKQLMDPDILEIRLREYFNVIVKVYYFHIGPEPIWGATGRIVKHFLDVVNLALEDFSTEENLKIAK